MGSRLLAIVLMAFSASVCGRAQSIVSTILGGTPDGVQALLASLNDPCSVASDRNGNVYAGIKGTHQVVRIDSNGMVWLVAGAGILGSTGDGGPAKSATLSTPAGLALDSAGNLYIADSDGNRVRRVGTDGVISTFAGTGKSGYSGDGGPATAARLTNPSALAFDAGGDLLIADTANHVIRMVAPGGGIATIAGNGAQGSSGNGGPAVQATLNSPAGVAVDSAGDIYIADTHNLWIRKVTPDGTINRFAGVDPANPPASGADTTIATNYNLTLPTSLALDQAGNLFAVEYGAVRVLRITPGGTISSYAGTGTPGSSGDGGWARFANLNVVGIAMGAQNNLLIADGTSNRVRIITAANGLIATLAGNGLGSYNPRGLAVDGNNNIYFSDGSVNRVRRLNPATGEVDTIAGNGLPAYAGDGAAATQASLNLPRGLALDGSGNLYIADSGNNVVRRVTTGGIVSTVAGTGAATSTGDGFPATQATIHTPAAVVVDASGNLFIAEAAGHYVRKVGTNGIISTVAGMGTAGAPSAETGIAIVQMLNTPQGLAVETAGTLLIADSGNNRIRRLFPDGTIATVAGSRTAGSSGDGGPAASALLWGPAGIAADSAGNLYIADTSNAKIRRVGSDGIITTIGGTGTRTYNGDGSPATAYSLNAPSAVLPASGCSLAVADTSNQRIRRLWPAVDYTIASNPQGLQAAVDGQAPAATPFVVSLLPGTQHNVNGPGPQAGPSGTRYLPAGSQIVTVPCGPARATVTLSFAAQYSLTVVTDDGGSVSPAAAWQNAGASVTLQATAQSGYVFAYWAGDCTGGGTCQLVMNGPRNVKAVFVPAHVQKGVIASGGVVGGGLSTPPVTQLSPNGVATIFGNSFAPAGTNVVVGPANLVNGQVPTEIDGVCVLVGSTQAPVLALTPVQINFQVPQVAVPGTFPVQVATGCGSAQELRSDPAMAPIQSASPEFFYFVNNSSGLNPVAAVNAATGVLIGSPGLVSGATFVPAKPGDVLTLYATGLGPTNPAFAAGVLPATTGPITGVFSVSVGSTALAPADVQYVGVSQSNAGVYEVRIHLPASTPSGYQSVQISVNGFQSPVGGYITVGQ